MLPELKADTPIYSVSTYEQSMTFYLRRTVVLVDYWDEFTFGLRQQPELSIPPSTVRRQVEAHRQRQGHGHHQQRSYELKSKG
jgi:hypothetical protein